MSAPESLQRQGPGHAAVTCQQSRENKSGAVPSFCSTFPESCHPMLFLVVLGGAAVLEVHRALHHGGGNGDVKALRERESALRKKLQARGRQEGGCWRGKLARGAVAGWQQLSLPSCPQFTGCLAALAGRKHHGSRPTVSIKRLGPEESQGVTAARSTPPPPCCALPCMPLCSPSLPPSPTPVKPAAFLPQDIQRDLKTAQQQRQLTEDEAAQLAAVNQRLTCENADLSTRAASLASENEELAARADSLLERQVGVKRAAGCAGAAGTATA